MPVHQAASASINVCCIGFLTDSDLARAVGLYMLLLVVARAKGWVRL